MLPIFPFNSLRLVFGQHLQVFEPDHSLPTVPPDVHRGGPDQHPGRSTSADQQSQSGVWPGELRPGIHWLSLLLSAPTHGRPQKHMVGHSVSSATFSFPSSDYVHFYPWINFMSQFR